jgi:hypothetical protein
MAQYGAPNPVYEANSTPMVNRGSNQYNFMPGRPVGLPDMQQQRQQPGMFEGWGAAKGLMGPASWGLEALSPGSGNDFTGWLKKMFMGSPEEMRQFPLYGQGQQDAMSQLLQRGLGGLDQFDFGPIEQQARTNFQQKTLPTIAERFTSMGAQGSSAFQQMLGQAGAGLEENIASMKQKYNLARQPMFQDMINTGLKPQYETDVKQRQPGIFENMMPGVGQAAQGGASALMSQFLPMLLAAL